MNRRGFLKVLGLGSAVAAVAPVIETSRSVGGLFIPKDRLDFGVPRTAFAEPAPPEPIVRTLILRTMPDGSTRFVPTEMTLSAYKDLARSELYAANAMQADRNAESIWWGNDTRFGAFEMV